MALFTRRRMAAAVAAITMTSVLLALPTGAAATTVSGTPTGCSATISTDGHTSTVKCAGLAYHGKAYRVTANTCSTSGCSSIGSGMVAYGTTVTLNGGGGFIASNSFAFKWANATTSPSTQWCSFTKVGGKVAWCDMQASIQYWAGTVQPLYDESGGTHPDNWYHDQQYRPDCSGTVSMSWHSNTSGTNHGYWTGTLDDTNVSHAVKFSYGTTSAYVQPGDTLDDITDGHAVIFAGWDSDHVHFKVWSFGIPGTHLTNADLLDKQPDSNGVGYEPKANYKAYRYVNATGTIWG